MSIDVSWMCVCPYLDIDGGAEGMYHGAIGSPLAGTPRGYGVDRICVFTT